MVANPQIPQSRQRQSKANENGICRLCHVSSELRNSHIFPSSFIKLTRDESINGRFCEIHDRVNSIVQDGPKEHLLCERCEQRLGRYEKYAKEAIHLSRHDIDILQDDNIAVIANLDYRKVKLFLLSVIWRMSVSSLPQCESVVLGEHEDIIRRMIIEDDPGESGKYPIAAMLPLINGNMQEGWLITPFVSKQDDGNIYATILGGILYYICVAPKADLLDPRFVLKESGTWAMPMADWRRIPFLNEFFSRQFGGDDAHDCNTTEGQ